MDGGIDTGAAGVYRWVVWVVWEVDPAPFPPKPSPLLRKRAITHLGDCLPKETLHQIWILSHLGSRETESENFL